MEKVPLYQVIMQDLTEKIERGDWQKGEAISTEAELERQYAVSNITVRRALNELGQRGLIVRIKGKGSFVSEGLPAADTAVQGVANSRVISLIVPFDSSTGSAMHIIRGLTECINGSGFMVNVVNSKSDKELEREMLLSCWRDSAGIIFYPITAQCNMDILCMMAAAKYPVVIIDKNLGQLPFCCIESDNLGGSYAITEYLIRKGHSNIAFVNHTPIEYTTSMTNRFHGYVSALSDNGIDLCVENIFSDYNALAKKYCPNAYRDLQENNGLVDSFEEFYRMLIQKLLDRKVTAVFSTHDGLAADLIKIAPLMGVKIPSDLSVVGFDNLLFSAHLAVPLTTVNQNLHEMGYKAGMVLIGGLDQRVPIRKADILIPTEIVERESVRDLSPQKMVAGA